MVDVITPVLTQMQLWNGLFVQAGAKAGIEAATSIGGTAKDIWKGVQGIGDFLKGINIDNLLESFAERGVPREIIERLKTELSGARGDIPILSHIMGLLQMIMLGAIAVGNYGEGLKASLSTISNSIFLPSMGNFDDLLIAQWRGTPPGETDELFKALGYGPQWRQIMEQGRRGELNVEQIMELSHRLDLDREGRSELLKRVGWNDSQTRILMEGLSYSFLAPGELLEAYRRGVLTTLTIDGQGQDMAQRYYLDHKDPDKLLDRYLRGLRYAPYERAIIKEIGKPLLDSRTAIEGHFRKTPKLGDITERLKRHGFDDDQAAIILDASHQLLRELDITTLLWRGIIKAPEAKKRLSFLGYKDADQDLFLQSRKLLLTPSDLIRAAVKEAFNPEIIKEFGLFEELPPDAIEYAKKIGYDLPEFKLLWGSHWDLPSPGQGFALFHRDVIKKPQLELLLKALDVMPFWRGKLIELSYNLIPRRVLGRLVNRGLQDEDQIYERFKKLGYSPADALLMARNTIVARDNRLINLTVSEISNALRRGHITINEASAFLTRLKVWDPKASYIIAEAERKRLFDGRTQTLDTDKETADQARQLTKGELLKGFRAGLLSRTETTTGIIEIGYSPEATAWLLDYEDLRKLLDTREHTADQIGKLYQARLISPENALTRLTEAGFIPKESKGYIDAWTLDRTVSEALAGVTDRLPTRGDLKKWYVNGIISGERWISFMSKLGYNDELTYYYFLEIEDKLEE